MTPAALTAHRDRLRDLVRMNAMGIVRGFLSEDRALANVRRACDRACAAGVSSAQVGEWLHAIAAEFEAEPPAGEVH